MNNKCIVVREFKFEAAHYLPRYDGPCGQMHGHSYKLQVGVVGNVNPENGMVLDFGKLKETVNVLLIQHLDHTCLNEITSYLGFPADMPTAENMVVWIAERLSAPFQKDGLQLEFVKLWETDTSFAMWARPIFPEAVQLKGIDEDTVWGGLPMENPSEEMLNVHSIFESISGEAGFFQQGSWCAFIRLQGCNLRCPWCDTKDSQDKSAFPNNHRYVIPAILKQIKQKQVLITGGEPLLQPETFSLIKALLAAGKDVQVETNGTFPIPTEPEFDMVRWVVDYKLPSAHSNKRFNAVSLAAIPGNAVIKFVISSLPDWEHAISCMYLCKHAPSRKNPAFIISIIPNKEVSYDLVVKSIQKNYANLLSHITFSMQVHKAMGIA